MLNAANNSLQPEHTYDPGKVFHVLEMLRSHLTPDFIH
eukprot:SAG31_NODE_2590_length_5426_cov_4.118265_1_plen_38_part_00